jgi:hypothetical protein
MIVRKGYQGVRKAWHNRPAALSKIDSREQTAESREQKAESREQRAESRERRKGHQGV